MAVFAEAAATAALIVAAGTGLGALGGVLGLIFKYRLDKKQAALTAEQAREEQVANKAKAERDAREGKFVEVEKVSPIMGGVITMLNEQLQFQVARTTTLEEESIKSKKLASDTAVENAALRATVAEQAETIESQGQHITRLEQQVADLQEALRRLEGKP